MCRANCPGSLYWAAWADALPVLHARRPDAAARFLAELAAGPAAAAACLRAAAEAGCVLDGAGFLARNAICLNLARGAKVGSITVPAPTLPTFAELLPYLAQAMLRSQSGPHAAAWLSAIPSEAGFALPPDRMLIALRRRLRLPLPVAPHRCGAHGHGCGAAVDADGDHHAACPRTGLLARRAKPLEHAWVSIVREAVGPEGQVVPQQWLARTSARDDVDTADRHRLDLVVYRATPLVEALCCDVTFVSPVTRGGRRQPCVATRDGAAITVAERRKRVAYPELLRPGPQRLYVLACEVGGRCGVPSRFASSLNSCASEPSALLPPRALRLGRVGCAAGAAS